MNEPVKNLVSVIVPVYNSGHTVTRAIDSALAQKGVDLEVVVVDDASSDDTVAVLFRHYADEPRVRIFRSAENGGPGVARNRAIDEARGEWLAVLDADDRFHPGRLARLLKTATENGADLIADAYTMCDAKMLQPFVVRGASLTRGILSAVDVVQHHIGSCKPLFRARFLRTHGIHYKPDAREAEDLILLLSLMLAGARFYFDPQPGYDKIIEPTSITANREKLLPGVIASCRYLLALPRVQADAPLHAALTRHLQHVIDANAANRLQGTLRRAGLWAMIFLLVREPRLFFAALRHALFRRRRFTHAHAYVGQR